MTNMTFPCQCYGKDVGSKALNGNLVERTLGGQWLGTTMANGKTLKSQRLALSQDY